MSGGHKLNRISKGHLFRNLLNRFGFFISVGESLGDAEGC